MENQQHICVVCGHVHDDQAEGKWEELSDEFQCPECGVGKEDYYIL
jgi:rubredoxin